MDEIIERRKYKRFEIPGGTAKIGKVQGYSSLFRPLSKTCPIMNASVGGINILCTRALNTGEDFLLELHAPGEKALKLRAKVIWTKPVPLSKDILTGFEFYSFGEGRDQNPPEAMSILRRLYARYIKV